MKADELKLEELVKFSEGLLSLHGRRLIIHDLHAFGQFRKDIIDMAELKYARKILTRFGYYQGQADAAAMKRIFKWDSMEEWLYAGARLQSLQGVAKAHIKILSLDKLKKTCHIEIQWHNSGEAEEHLSQFGRSDHPVCWILTGYISGYVSFCLDFKVFFIEKKCSAESSKICMAEGKDEKSWAGDLKDYASYFETEDIVMKVETLTKELQKKDREILRQQQKIDTLEKNTQLDMIEVHSASFRKVLEMVSQVSRFDTSVLIVGESGTGKDVISKYIHNLSPRQNKNFIAINCGALPATLLEGELFGYKAGAFTGAIRDRTGLLEQADKGTILLDEIGEISQEIQVKLLRVLQEREIVRLGENIPRKIDVRIIAATNRNVKEDIAKGLFREDLYYRLAVVTIELPSLRERKEDILSLARHLVSRISKKLKLPHLKLDAKCLDYLLEYDWPGNIRELENAIEYAAVFAGDGVIMPEHLPKHIVSMTAKINIAKDSSLKSMEYEHILSVLKRTEGNKTKAAEILGIGIATLWRKLKQMNSEKAK
jgi:DNA-binding NtrC family response regulator/predicted hydrocarbon binding protein